MKMRKMVAMVVAVVMMVSLVGCGEISYDKIAGDWTLASVNGQSIEDYAASLGATVGQVAVNYTIKDDDTITSTSSAASETYKIQRKADGFEVLQNGSEEIFFSVAYDEDKQTLSYKLKIEGAGEMTYVMKKGTTDLTAVETAPEAATEAAQ